MKKRLQALRNEEGLTLVELLAVIVILAIIAVVAFVMIGQVIENSRQDAHVSNAQQLIQSAKLYEASGGLYGTSHDATDGEVEGTHLQDEGYIDEIIDPWTKAVITGNEGTVEKTPAGVYTVELEGSKCSTDGAKTLEELSKEGRKSLDCP